MKCFQFNDFGLDRLALRDLPAPAPGPGEVLVDVRAISLNYRDALVVEGAYNPRFRELLPATPISDGAGQVTAVGEGVTSVAVGDKVCSVFVSGWIDGPFQEAYLATTLGVPRAGMAAEFVVLPEAAVLRTPSAMGFEEASTLPCAALTAWSALVTEGGLAVENPSANADKWVLTLGTGGVSTWVVLLAKALGARVAITSSSDAKLAVMRELGPDGGADLTVNYRTDDAWAKTIREATEGGAHVSVDTAGGETIGHVIRATRAGGVVGVIGALTGLESSLNLGTFMMRRITLAGIMVDSRAAQVAMIRFLNAHPNVRPRIDRTLPFAELPRALRDLKTGGHIGKIVLTMDI